GGHVLYDSLDEFQHYHSVHGYPLILVYSFSTDTGTNSNVSTSTDPRSVIFNLGITAKDINPSDIIGFTSSATPRTLCAILVTLFCCSVISSPERLLIIPPTGNAIRAMTCPSFTKSTPPSCASNSFTASAISASFYPVTI